VVADYAFDYAFVMAAAQDRFARFGQGSLTGQERKFDNPTQNGPPSAA
jgi:hypothetical protein